MVLEPVCVVGPGLACKLALGCSLGTALVGLGLGPKMGPQNKQKWALSLIRIIKMIK